MHFVPSIRCLLVETCLAIFYDLNTLTTLKASHPFNLTIENLNCSPAGFPAKERTREALQPRILTPAEIEKMRVVARVRCVMQPDDQNT